jgi:cellulose synthase/poly-beta-1,6-N-acetylglucosamine synthase-like glycosyltransferase
LAGWLRLKKPENKELKPTFDLPFVSIVIPVRNEGDHILACLESIYKQAYPQDLLEVVVIDDYSVDDTLEKLRDMRRWNLKVLDLRQYLGLAGEETPNKKKAIALGIKNAKGSLIVTIDGDCTMEENWLQSMVSCYLQKGYKMLTGPIAIRPAKGPFAWFQQLEVMDLSVMVGSTIKNGLSATCTGANLLYAKDTFSEVEGFKGNYDVPAGDDIFLMQKIQKRHPGSIGYLKSLDACVYTKTQSLADGFISQRIRWISKCTDFSDWKFSAAIYFTGLFHVLVLLSAIFAFQPQEMNWLPIAITGGTLVLSNMLFNLAVTIFFRKKLLLLLFPLVVVFHILYVIIIGVLSLSGKYDWKDRSVK